MLPGKLNFQILLYISGVKKNNNNNEKRYTTNLSLN